MGHKVVKKQASGVVERAVFGYGQIIRRDPKTGVLTAGSDSRADGMAIGWC
jgi:gamma-glutamyltranspeptidase/glutathione hydrolase